MEHGSSGGYAAECHGKNAGIGGKMALVILHVAAALLVCEVKIGERNVADHRKHTMQHFDFVHQAAVAMVAGCELCRLPSLLLACNAYPVQRNNQFPSTLSTAISPLQQILQQGTRKPSLQSQT
jgi:hypothetical protein